MIETWTEAGLITHFAELHERMPDRAFAFLLGSGASRSSDIPTGGELVARWLRELKERRDASGEPLEEWATAERLGIPGFVLGQAAAFYPQIFVARFGRDPDEGYAFLESIMEGKEPSFGYSVLAQILAATRHRVVITTNFDNLVSDAVSLFTRSQALVCGHELLTGFVRARLRRPLVAKIHRDLLLEPLNQPEAVSSLLPGWPQALRTLLGAYTPIVIGYGGNDGSLMDLLRELNPGDVTGGIYWCYRGADGPPPQPILDVVARHRGVVVPILGFDELFLELGDRLKLPLLDKVLEDRASERVQRYRDAVSALVESLRKSPQEARSRLLHSLQSIAIANKSPLSRLVLAKTLAHESPEKAEAIYREELASNPDDAVLCESFGLFLAQRGRAREATGVLHRALALAPERQAIRETLKALGAEDRAPPK